MLEGGRWLLTMFTTGAVTYYDLDAPVITENILIPDQFDPKNRSTFRMAVAIDQESLFLAFNLALSFCSAQAPTANPKEHCIQIWKVVLVLNGQQRGVGLRSVLLASFPQEPLIEKIYILSLLGSHVAFTAECSECYQPEQTFIVNWKMANGKSVNFPRQLLYPVWGPKVCYFFVQLQCLLIATKRKPFTFFRATEYFWGLRASQCRLII